MVGHKDRGQRRQYIVRCYGCGPEDDTLEVASNISKHFIVSNNKQEIRKQASA